MAGRPQSTKVDIEAMQRLVLSLEGAVDYNPIIALTMRNCKATYREIGEVLGVSHQMARTLVTSVKEIVR